MIYSNMILKVDNGKLFKIKSFLLKDYNVEEAQQKYKESLVNWIMH